MKKHVATNLRQIAPIAAAFLAVTGALSVCLLLVSRQHRSATSRRNRYDRIIDEAADRHGVSPFLVKAVIYRESSFQPWVTGDANEVGLMQIRKETAVADWERVTGQRCPFDGLLFDPRLNIEIGTWYLARALNQWQGYRDREVLALAQYNAGRTNAREWAPKDKRETVRRSSISFDSTREYISKVLEARKMFERESLNGEKH
ncbi:MAG: lytic transglycosylase domain-containing protein [Lentisphaerae bacterium]|jgi:soluble lytic murein transglycosylase|nr:lytic transglycosylase domain-containing protein [Lentisphaerota bacterium]MBT4819297.1 lytic transglycosylase domain-containing protein [Lentisphaerota bacterium]MBT5610549.1 lytic transglycosylase domain-containing protein [Lentisphaerota bacterium]MBT7054421.1 lytic transglycosylase domain-containing protein [Lentisphaerota bacterium]MBT7842590.1 lytic transglycosylase domain-containing protein [Lentisphaerota bacterium]